MSAYPLKNYVSKDCIMLLLVLLLASVQAVQADTFSLPFDEGDRVCFVGDSITHGGAFHHDIRLYHLTRFPLVHVSFFNCGIGGDTAESVLRRMDEDVLVNNPDRAMLMLGMNDVGRQYYPPDNEPDEKVLRKREEAISKYEGKMEELVSKFLSENVELVLQTPSIYDGLTIMDNPANVGVNQALKQCAVITKELAKRHQLPVVDYWTPMNEIAVRLNKKNPHETIIGKDRVHPKEVGNFIMCYTFLKDAKAPRYVSNLRIGKNTCDAENCEIDQVVWEKESLSFNCKASALPYPLPEEKKKALEFVPFNEDFNVEFLRVRGLGKGDYSLAIDGQEIDSFTSKQLRKGINLALHENTPQYRQAVEVRSILEKLWEREVQLRDIKFVESRSQFKSCPYKEDLEKLKAYYLEQFGDSKYIQYHRWVIGQYVEHKPNEASYENEMKKLREKAYEQAEPSTHHYQIVKLH